MKFRSIDVFGIEGVYLLYCNNELVYCGESLCCLTRVVNHNHEKAILFDDFEIIPSKNRKELEKELIVKHCPKLNKQHNPNHVYVNNRKGGRKPGLNKKAIEKAKKCAELYNKNDMTVPEIMKKLKIGSKATFYKYIRIAEVDLKS